MKKLLSLVIAAVFTFAVCVPAFAEDVTGPADSSAEDAQTSNVKVTTNTDEAESEYTVTIPADLDIAWLDSSEQDMNYSVYTNLLEGASLDVSVSADNGGVMTGSGSDSLTFTLTSAAQTFTLFNAAGTEPATDVTVSIAEGQWKQAAIGVYEGSLTYTVTYTPAD